MKDIVYSRIYWPKFLVQSAEFISYTVFALRVTLVTVTKIDCVFCPYSYPDSHCTWISLPAFKNCNNLKPFAEIFHWSSRLTYLYQVELLFNILHCSQKVTNHFVFWSYTLAQIMSYWPAFVRNRILLKDHLITNILIPHFFEQTGQKKLTEVIIVMQMAPK